MWASKKIREQRKRIIINKHLLGWRVKDIASFIGISSGSVSNIIRRHQNRRRNEGTPVTQE